MDDHAGLFGDPDRVVAEARRGRERPEQLVQAGLTSRADVVAASVAAIGRQGEGVHDVVDEHEVAGLGAVPRNGDVDALQHGADHGRDVAAVSVPRLAWAVRGAQCQDRPFQSVLHLPCVQPGLDRHEGGTVGRDRSQGQRLDHREIVAVDLAVDGQRVGGHDHLAHVGADRGFEEVDGPDDDVTSRPDGVLGGTVGWRHRAVEHDFGADAADDVAHRVGDEFEPVELQRARVLATGSIQVGEAAGREVVDDHDAPALGQQSVHQGRPDESGTAGHQGDPVSGLGGHRGSWRRERVIRIQPRPRGCSSRRGGAGSRCAVPAGRTRHSAP